MEEIRDSGGITREELYGFHLGFTDWALDETPCIIELCVGDDVGLRNLLFILGAQHLCNR